jgi:hypothetical protein
MSLRSKNLNASAVGLLIAMYGMNGCYAQNANTELRTTNGSPLQVFTMRADVGNDVAASARELGMRPNPHGETDPYSTAKTSSLKDYNDWMTKKDDSTPILDMSIPGAVSSLSNSNHQSLSIDDQLKIGIRAFDVNLTVYHASPKDDMPGEYTTSCNELATLPASSHNVCDSFPMFDLSQKLQIFNNFLNNHPREVLVIKFNRNTRMGDDVDKWVVLTNNALSASGLDKHLAAQVTSTATLGQLRGKVLVINDVAIPGTNYEGIPSSSNLSKVGISVTDRSSEITEPVDLTNNSGLWKGWVKIKDRLKTINSDHATSGSGKLRWTYVSGMDTLSETDLAVPFAASGYDSREGHPLITGDIEKQKNPKNPKYPDFNRFACTGVYCSIYYTGLNFMLYDGLTHANTNAGEYSNNGGSTGWSLHGYHNLGVIMLSYPGRNLVDQIIGTNS